MTVKFYPTCIYVSFVAKYRNFLTEGRTPVAMGSVQFCPVLPGSVQVLPGFCSGCRCLAGCSAVVLFCSGCGYVQVLWVLFRCCLGSALAMFSYRPCSGHVQIPLDSYTTAGNQHRTRPEASPEMRQIPSFIGGDNRRAQG